MSGHTLVICEKPDAARRVSEALSGGPVAGILVRGVPVFRFRSGAEEFVVCAAQGHVYAVSDPFAERSVYPVFDVEWYGNSLVVKGVSGAERRIAAISEMAGGASKFVNACDFDVEGETIAFNVLRYACGGKESEAFRAKFSTLTKDDVVAAFGNMEKPRGNGMADAGRARHFVDFVWGVNLSRVLSLSALGAGHRYRTVSMGRVQGPTLNFVVDREREIRGYVPRPYWAVTGVFDWGGRQITASYAKSKLDRRAEAEKVQADCSGGTAEVAWTRKSSAQVSPPPPFNIGDLQKEAYSAFGYSPSRTLQIAERLYLGALISYPRTGSQRLPPSIGYRKILQGLAQRGQYSKPVAAILAGELRPVQGPGADLAHPAIHPTGERRRKPLDASEARVYDLVVKRFLSGFAPPAKTERVSANLSVNGHSFLLDGTRTIELGWLRYYAPYGRVADGEIPPVKRGDRLAVVAVKAAERFESRPPRYNQSTLLERMEKEKIGTKATRAEIIATLVDRGYVSGESLTASDLGFSVVETMERHASDILSTELTRSMEGELEAVEEGEKDAKGLVRAAVRAISEQLAELNLNEEEVGRAIDSAVMSTVADRNVLGPCPVCKTGKLRVIKSKKTGKRFVGCSNYGSGCRASAPLPQRGLVKVAPKACTRCAWPVVYVVARRFPWRLCVNPNCPSKGGKKA
ncbi:MAG: DNA topoisomerase I [Nitrososphaerales archaeon]|nr:DNA topoisomerase I [Nitrososphaerales archaeon]